MNLNLLNCFILKFLILLELITLIAALIEFMGNINSQDLYYKNNRLQKIRGFYYVAKFGSITKAANTMLLTQPAVSIQINALEKELGVSLLERKSGKVTLTAEGMEFYEKCVPVIESIEELFNNFEKQQEDKDANYINIIANNATVSNLLPWAIKEYFEIMPNMLSRIYNARKQHGLQLLREEKAEIFVTPRWHELQQFPEFEYTGFVKFIPSLITLPDHPLAGKRNVTLKEMAEYNLILSDQNFLLIPGLDDLFERHNIKKIRKIELINFNTPRKYVDAGVGIWITTNAMLDPDDKLVATPLLHYLPITDYVYIVRKGHKISNKTKLFIDVLKKLYPDGICTYGLTSPVEELRKYF